MICIPVEKKYRIEKTMSDNRRIHKRVPIAGSASLSFHGREGEVSIDAMISNISLSGIGIYADRQIEDGTEVSIDINFISSDGLMKNTRIKGNIVYAREMEKLFFTGIEFSKEINPEKHKDLYNHIQQSLKWY